MITDYTMGEQTKAGELFCALFPQRNCQKLLHASFCIVFVYCIVFHEGGNSLQVSCENGGEGLQGVASEAAARTLCPKLPNK